MFFSFKNAVAASFFLVMFDEKVEALSAEEKEFYNELLLDAMEQRYYERCSMELEEARLQADMDMFPEERIHDGQEASRLSDHCYAVENRRRWHCSRCRGRGHDKATHRPKKGRYAGIR
jgi:hypothetical protein